MTSQSPSVTALLKGEPKFSLPLEGKGDREVVDEVTKLKMHHSERRVRNDLSVTFGDSSPKRRALCYP